MSSELGLAKNVHKSGLAEKGQLLIIDLKDFWDVFLFPRNFVILMTLRRILAGLCLHIVQLGNCY